MKIGDLARRAGVNIQTIRYYERERVMRQPLRTPSGYRTYTDRDLQNVFFIKQCQRLGFTLREIGQLSPLHDDVAASRQRNPRSWETILAVAGERLRAIDEKIAALQDMRRNLSRLVAQTVPCKCPAQKARAK